MARGFRGYEDERVIGGRGAGGDALANFGAYLTDGGLSEDIRAGLRKVGGVIEKLNDPVGYRVAQHSAASPTSIRRESQEVVPNTPSPAFSSERRNANGWALPRRRGFGIASSFSPDIPRVAVPPVGARQLQTGRTETQMSKPARETGTIGVMATPPNPRVQALIKRLSEIQSAYENATGRTVQADDWVRTIGVDASSEALAELGAEELDQVERRIQALGDKTTRYLYSRRNQRDAGTPSDGKNRDGRRGFQRNRGFVPGESRLAGDGRRFNADGMSDRQADAQVRWAARDLLNRSMYSKRDANAAYGRMMSSGALSELMMQNRLRNGLSPSATIPFAGDYNQRVAMEQAQLDYQNALAEQARKNALLSEARAMLMNRIDPSQMMRQPVTARQTSRDDDRWGLNLWPSSGRN